MKYANAKPNRIEALTTVGVPYSPRYPEYAIGDMKAQAERITQGLRENGFDTIEGIEITSDKKIIALIAYLQRLGTDISGDTDPFGELPSSKKLSNVIVEDN
jgi:cytochrome c oxidase cbb3-type subunit I/II